MRAIIIKVEIVFLIMSLYAYNCGDFPSGSCGACVLECIVIKPRIERSSQSWVPNFLLRSLQFIATRTLVWISNAGMRCVPRYESVMQAYAAYLGMNQRHALRTLVWISNAGIHCVPWYESVMQAVSPVWISIASTVRSLFTCKLV